LQLLPGQTKVEIGEGGKVNVHFAFGTANLGKVNQHCFDNGIVLNHLQMKRRSLEAKFLEMTS